MEASTWKQRLSIGINIFVGQGTLVLNLLINVGSCKVTREEARTRLSTIRRWEYKSFSLSSVANIFVEAIMVELFVVAVVVDTISSKELVLLLMYDNTCNAN